MPERDAFGLPTVPDDESDEFAFLKDAEPAAPAPEAPAEGEAPVEPAPAKVTPEEAPAPAETVEGETPPQLLAGRYQSVEELEKGYRELRDLHRRTAERAKA